MNQKQNEVRQKYARRSQVISAIAHPTRLAMLDLLHKAPMCVGELAEEMGCDISTVSKHLALMKNAGVLADSKAGNKVYYAPECKEFKGFMKCVDAIIEAKK